MTIIVTLLLARAAWWALRVLFVLVALRFLWKLSCAVLDSLCLAVVALVAYGMATGSDGAAQKTLENLLPTLMTIVKDLI